MLSEYDSFLSAGIFWPLVFEVIINLVFLPPNVEGVYNVQGSIYVHYNYETLFNFNNINNATGIEGQKEILLLEDNKVPVDLYYGLSNVLTIFIIFRCYHFVRIIYTFSYWAT